MKKILLISDTHNYIDESILTYARQVNEVWHAGDIGSLQILEQLQQSGAIVRAVYGNIDGQEIRIQVPKVAQFECDGVKVMMTHIGGYPGKYEQSIRKQILDYKPYMFISGHSHILKVMYDKSLNLLHLNPGAVGKTGFHLVRTMILFEIENGKPQNLQVVEFKRWE